MPLTLHVFGVAHEDALGKVHLIAALQTLLREMGTRPAFVAVEFDRGKFHEVRTRGRDRFRQKLLCQWPAMAPDVLDPLVASLWYEPDAVASVFPTLEPVWLDAGVTDPTDGLPCRWFEQYKEFGRIGAVDFIASPSTALIKLSKAAWEEFDQLQPELERGEDPRDERFATVMIQEALSHEGGPGQQWAVAIVGAAHAMKWPGRFAHRIDEAGFDCPSALIRPADWNLIAVPGSRAPRSS